MGKCLHVRLADHEMREIQRLAKREGMTVAKCVRRVFRDACANNRAREIQTKLDAIRRAAQYSFPTADIGQMLREIETDRIRLE
jgi:thymidylate synthase ThyX